MWSVPLFCILNLGIPYDATCDFFRLALWFWAPNGWQSRQWPNRWVEVVEGNVVWFFGFRVFVCVCVCLWVCFCVFVCVCVWVFFLKYCISKTHSTFTTCTRQGMPCVNLQVSSPVEALHSIMRVQETATEKPCEPRTFWRHIEQSVTSF